METCIPEKQIIMIYCDHICVLGLNCAGFGRTMGLVAVEVKLFFILWSGSARLFSR